MYNLCVEEKNEKRVMEVSREIDMISSLLNKLGIPRNTAGYNYLLSIVLKINRSNSINLKLTKELYPQIADEFDSSVKSIERGLRYSIEAAWDRNREGIKDILGYYTDSKPYTGEFIWLLADKFRMINSKNGYSLTS